MKKKLFCSTQKKYFTHHKCGPARRPARWGGPGKWTRN